MATEKRSEAKKESPHENIKLCQIYLGFLRIAAAGFQSPEFSADVVLPVMSNFIELITPKAPGSPRCIYPLPEQGKNDYHNVILWYFDLYQQTAKNTALSLENRLQIMKTLLGDLKEYLSTQCETNAQRVANIGLHPIPRGSKLSSKPSYLTPVSTRKK